MASSEKFTDDAMCNMLRHNDRATANPTNKDIDPERTKLNYSFPLNHKGMTDYEYYKKLVGEKYLYGRGTAREKDAVTGCGWVVTLPREIQGYPDKEKAFFQATFDFISERYGRENIINNAVHYDEAGAPHIHVVFCPVTNLDHDIVQHKTVKTTKSVKLESGRYEYQYRFKLDDNGEKIKLKNYAKMSDYYDEKIDCNSVLNKIELRNFHQNLQKYLTDNGIEGAVINGKTGGVNFSVKELKEFTAKTGLHLDEVKEMQGDKTLLESFVERDAKVHQLEEIIQAKEIQIETLQHEVLTKDIALDKSDEIISKDEQIKELTHTITEKNQELTLATKKNQNLENRLSEMQHVLEEKQRELDQAQAKVEQLEKEKAIEKSQTEKVEEWGHSSSGWGDKSQSGWGTRTNDIEEERTW